MKNTIFYSSKNIIGAKRTKILRPKTNTRCTKTTLTAFFVDIKHDINPE